jgi:sugar transferase (PEP-CTERM/EpsH1 system associated)
LKLLFLTPQLPFPPRQGTALRNWGLISNLAKRHEVWLLSFDDGVGVHEELRRVCKSVLTFPVPTRDSRARLRTLLTSPLPDMAWRLWSHNFRKIFEQWVEEKNFDIIQIEGIELARYVLESSSIEERRSKIVFDDHNCEYLMQQRWYERDRRSPQRWHAAAYSLVQSRRLREFERRIVQTADATLCVSKEDQDALAHLADVRPHVIYNGIDVETYAAFAEDRNHKLEAIRHATHHASQATLLFTGKMDFRPNIDAVLWFVQEVLPIVHQSEPNAILKIVGQKPSPRLEALRTHLRVEITGAVDDIRPHIADADVYVAPLRVGGGTRFKLLEAMAMRKAIVTSSLGCEGFNVQSGREMMIADEPTAFAQTIVDLLRDKNRRDGLGNRAFAFVSSAYDWKAIVPKVEKVYEQIRQNISA